MTDAYLKSWLDRVERLEEEQRGVGSDKRDLYAEAKGKGYNVKALRRIVAGRRRKDEREVEAEIDRYKIALGLAVDLVRDEKLSLRDAAKRAGVSKSSVHRALAVPAVSHDPETGEVTTSGDDAGHRSEPSAPAEQSVNPVSPPRPSVAIIGCGEGEQPGTHSASEVAVPPGDGEAPASNDAAGTPSPSIDESCGSPEGRACGAVGSEATDPRTSALKVAGTSATRGEAGVESGPQDTDLTSNDDAIAEMLAAEDRLDALKRQKGLAA